MYILRFFFTSPTVQNREQKEQSCAEFTGKHCLSTRTKYVFSVSFKSTVIHDMHGLAIAPSQNHGFMRIIHYQQNLIVAGIAIHSGTGHDLLTILADILLKKSIMRDNIPRLQHHFVTLKLSSGSGRFLPFLAVAEISST